MARVLAERMRARIEGDARSADALASMGGQQAVDGA